MNTIIIRFIFIIFACLYTSNACYGSSQLANIGSVQGNFVIEDGIIQIKNNMRIQASCIKCNNDTPGEFCIKASGKLMVNYKDFILIGDSFTYDEKIDTYTITNAKLAILPWFIGGETLLITPSNIIIHKGYISTSEGQDKHVLFSCKEICISPDKTIRLYGSTLKICNTSILCLPKMTINPTYLKKPPFTLRFGYSQIAGSYIGIKSHILHTKDYNGDVILDGFLNHGIGLGCSFKYTPKDKNDYFYIKNYYASNIPAYDVSSKDRFRFEGNGHFNLNDKITVTAFYDVPDSWKTVAGLFPGHFNMPNSHKTFISSSYQDDNLLAHVKSSVKVTKFQSINEELIKLYLQNLPIKHQSSGIVFNNHIDLSLLRYSYGDQVILFDTPERNYQSFRASINPEVYKNITYDIGNISATAKCNIIYYSNSPLSKNVTQASGGIDLNYNVRLFNKTQYNKHIIEPFIHYSIRSNPRIRNDDHYIFSIEDGFNFLNILKLGFNNHIYNTSPGYLCKMNLWALFMLDSIPIKDLYPKGFLDIMFEIDNTSVLNLSCGWIIKKNMFNHCNASWRWALNENIAIYSEWLFRSSYSLRKSDHDNLVIDSLISDQDLKSYELSGQKNVLLSKIFIKPHPLLTYNFALRYGMLKGKQPNYLEYNMEIETKIFEHWCVKLVHEKRTSDNKVHLSLNLKP